MQIEFNQQIISTSAETLLQLVQELELPEQGIALAVNQIVVAKSGWESCQLQANDQVSAFSAVAGG